MQGHLEANQQLVDKLQQQLSDAVGQQQALRASLKQLEGVSDAGRAAKAEARCGGVGFDCVGVTAGWGGRGGGMRWAQAGCSRYTLNRHTRYVVGGG